LTCLQHLLPGQTWLAPLVGSVSAEGLLIADQVHDPVSDEHRLIPALEKLLRDQSKSIK
jgi:hypothetical protein